MKRLTCVLCVLAVATSAMSGDLFRDPAEGSSSSPPKRAAAGATKGPARAVTLAEAEKLKKLREVAKGGDNKKIIEWTLSVDLKESTYAFRKEVLLTRAEAFRRRGQGLSAQSTYKTLMGYAVKQPAHCRKAETLPLVLPIQVLRHAKGGHYRSPVRSPKSGEKGPSIADDAGWETAKEDYAGILLDRLDAKVKKAKRITTPQLLQGKMSEALSATDAVRPHKPQLANTKAVELAGAFVDRFTEIVDGGGVTARAASMVDGSLMRSLKAVKLSKWRAMCEGILGNLRRLYVDSYSMGKVLTAYAREHDIEGMMSGPLATLKGKNDSLKRLFVQADNWYYYKGSRRGLTHKTIHNDPLSKIPTGKW